jgi:hypothetical protein
MDLFSGLDLNPSVTSFQSNTNTAMKSVKESSLTPADVTTANQKQGVALKTSRDTGVMGTISEYRSTAVEQLNGIIGSLSGGTLNLKDLTKSIRMGPDGITFSDNAIISAVSGAAGYKVSGQSGAARALSASLAAEFKKITGLNIGNILTTNGTKFRVNDNWRGQLGKQTLNMLGKAAGLDDLLDVSVKGAFYNSVLKNATIFGMSDSYRKIWDSYPKGFDLIKRDAAIEAMENVITNGDVESMDAMLKLFDTQTKNVLLGKYPRFVSILFSNFRFDKTAIPEEYPIIRAKLLAILEDLIGPEWYMKQTYFGKVLDLGLMNNASPDLKTLLQPVDDLVPLLCTAGMFHDASALGQLRVNSRVLQSTLSKTPYNPSYPAKGRRGYSYH